MNVICRDARFVRLRNMDKTHHRCVSTVPKMYNTPVLRIFIEVYNHTPY